MNVVGWIAKKEADAFEKVKLAERPCNDSSLRSLPYDEHHYEKRVTLGHRWVKKFPARRHPGGPQRAGVTRARCTAKLCSVYRSFSMWRPG